VAPGSSCINRDHPVEHAEGHVSRAQHRQRRRLRALQRIGGDDCRQVMELLGEQMAHGRRHGDRIGEEVVDGRQPRAGSAAPGGDLNGRRLAGKHREPVAG
jgi:hypothetical protein